MHAKQHDIFFQSDQELNSGPSGCHAPRALVGVLDHRATRTGTWIWYWKKQTYNNQNKYKKPKDIHKKPQKQNKTNPGLVASYNIQPGNGSGLLTKNTAPGPGAVNLQKNSSLYL